jgi:hypothetical protein
MKILFPDYLTVILIKEKKNYIIDQTKKIDTVVTSPIIVEGMA